MNKHLFISFEGLDGSGKDTQLFLLAQAIREERVSFGSKYTPLWITREPTHLTSAGKKLSKELKEGTLSPKEFSKLFVEDRKQHSTLISQQLSYGFVLSSRYDISTLTYQHAQGEDLEELFEMHDYGKKEGVVIPDITIVFALRVEESLKRISSRNQNREVFETRAFLQQAYESQKKVLEYIKEQQPHRVLLEIDASLPIDEVHEEVIKQLQTIIV